MNTIASLLGVLFLLFLLYKVYMFLPSGAPSEHSQSDNEVLFYRLLPSFEKDGRSRTIKQKLLQHIKNQITVEENTGSSVFTSANFADSVKPSERMLCGMNEAFTRFLEREYNKSLFFLKENPTSADAHQQTLSLGREYATAAREEGRVTIFDETALANDIRAATANASQSQKPISVQASNQPKTATSLKERISALTLMKESGLLSDEEFDRKRREILDQI